MKQAELAKKIGISKEALSNIENDISKPNIERIEDISNALEIEFNQLLMNPQNIIVNNKQLGYVSNNPISIQDDIDFFERIKSTIEDIIQYFSNKNKLD